MQHQGALEGLEPVHPVGLAAFQVGRQAIHLLTGPPGTGVHASARLGQRSEEGVQLLQGLQQGFPGFNHRLVIGHFRPGLTALTVTQAQTQVHAPFIHGGDQAIQLCQIGSGMPGFRQAIAAQFLNLPGAQGIRKKRRGNFGQLMRLIENHRVGRGQ